MYTHTPHTTQNTPQVFRPDNCGINAVCGLQPALALISMENQSGWACNTIAFSVHSLRDPELCVDLRHPTKTYSIN